MARTSTEVWATSTSTAWSRSRVPAPRASFSPCSDRSQSYQPVKRFSRFQTLWPCRSRTRVATATGAYRGGRDRPKAAFPQADGPVMIVGVEADARPSPSAPCRTPSRSAPPPITGVAIGVVICAAESVLFRTLIGVPGPGDRPHHQPPDRSQPGLCPGRRVDPGGGRRRALRPRPAAGWSGGPPGPTTAAVVAAPDPAEGRRSWPPSAWSWWPFPCRSWPCRAARAPSRPGEPASPGPPRRPIGAGSGPGCPARCRWRGSWRWPTRSASGPRSPRRPRGRPPLDLVVGGGIGRPGRRAARAMAFSSTSGGARRHAASVAAWTRRSRPRRRSSAAAAVHRRTAPPAPSPTRRPGRRPHPHRRRHPRSAGRRPGHPGDPPSLRPRGHPAGRRPHGGSRHGARSEGGAEPPGATNLSPICSTLLY